MQLLIFYFLRIWFPFRPCQSIDFFSELLEKAQDIPVQLPLVSTLSETLEDARGWCHEAQVMQDSDRHPHYDTLKRMLAAGRPLPIKLSLLAQLESRFAAAKGWVDRAVRTFMKKNSNWSVLEVCIFQHHSILFCACSF